MKRLVRPDERYEVLYPEDVRKISDELKLQGYLASDEDIAWAYSEWSEMSDTSETHQVSLLLDCGWNVWEIDGTPVIIKNGQVQPIKRETLHALLDAALIRVHQRQGTMVRYAKRAPEQRTGWSMPDNSPPPPPEPPPPRE